MEERRSAHGLWNPFEEIHREGRLGEKSRKLIKSVADLDRRAKNGGNIREEAIATGSLFGTLGLGALIIGQGSPRGISLGIGGLAFAAAMGALKAVSYFPEKYRLSRSVKNALRETVRARAANFVAERDPRDVKRVEERIESMLQASTDRFERDLLRTMLKELRKAKRSTIKAGGEKEAIKGVDKESFKAYSRITKSGKVDLAEATGKFAEGTVFSAGVTTGTALTSPLSVPIVSGMSSPDAAVPPNAAAQAAIEYGPPLILLFTILGGAAFGATKAVKGVRKIRKGRSYLKQMKDSVRKLGRAMDPRDLKAALREARIRKIQAKSGMEYQMWEEVEKELQNVAARKGLGERGRTLAALHI